MILKKDLRGLILILIVSLILSVLMVNTIGKKIEIFETRLYQKVSGKSPQHINFDSEGVPYVVYEGNLGNQYNAVTIAEQAINSSDQSDSSGIRIFFSCIHWLTNNYTILNDSSIMYLDLYDWPSFEMSSPWRSAMNQGRVMQAFIKAYEKTGDTLYLTLAKKSMNTLYTEVKDGGVTYIDSTGFWYEEYADDNAPQSRVLNGMIVVLQALSDLHKVTNDSNANYLFLRGVESLKHTLYLYDSDGHSNYDILGKPASPWYHNFHIELLDFLYSETHEPVFNDYKQKWLKYREPSYLTSVIEKPTNIGMFAVFTIFAGVFTILFIFGYFLWYRNPKVER